MNLLIARKKKEFLLKMMCESVMIKDNGLFSFVFFLPQNNISCESEKNLNEMMRLKIIFIY